jgi:hypothetical protein
VSLYAIEKWWTPSEQGRPGHWDISAEERQRLRHSVAGISSGGIRIGWWRCRDGVFRQVCARTNNHVKEWQGASQFWAWGWNGNFLLYPAPGQTTIEQHPYDLVEWIDKDCCGSGSEMDSAWHSWPCRCNRCEGLE